MGEVRHKRKMHLETQDLTLEKRHRGSLWDVFTFLSETNEHLITGNTAPKGSNLLRCSPSLPFKRGLKTLMEQLMGLGMTPPFKAILPWQKFPCLHVEWQYFWHQDNPFRWQIAELFTHKLHMSLHFNSSQAQGGRINLLLTHYISRVWSQHVQQ